LKSARPAGFFEVEDIAKWVFQLCDAMDYAHRQNVVHRDIKPANLMVNEHGDLKVGDFGIGRTVADTVNRLTRNSAGTPPFMSPQQTMGERALPTDDIYSIGATVYDLLTGDPPFFRGAIREQALVKVAPSMTDRRKELGRIGKPIPREWEIAVGAALSKESNQRPATGAQLRAMFEGKPAGLSESLASRPRASKWPIAAAVGIVGFALAGAAFWEWHSRVVAPPPAATRAPAPIAPPTTVPVPVPNPAPSAPVQPPSAANPAPSAPVQPPPPAPEKSPLDKLVDSAQVTRDEGSLLSSALAGQRGDFERSLADRLVNQHALTPADWRQYTSLVGPANENIGKLRPLLAGGIIREKEFGWLAAALAGTYGETERLMADRLINVRDFSPDQWRAQTNLYPPAVRDPNVEKVKQMFVSGLILASEDDWLRASLAGKNGDAEKTLANQLVAQKAITPAQWRAKTALAYPPGDASFANPAAWPPVVDLPLSDTVTVRLLRVDPGTFMRGTADDEIGRRANEPHPEKIAVKNPFYLGAFEVTQAQYTAVITRNPSYWRGHGDWPIDQVDWSALSGSNGFLVRLNRVVSKRYGGAMVADLPTEDEWEYACRAGTESSFYDGHKISDVARDDNLDALANYNGSSSGSPQSVGSYAPNAWGFYDMLGNVSEWCSDRYIRGGSWESNAAGCRVGWRTQYGESAAPSNQVGFRLVLRAKSGSQ
jgi:formylglycine-generating enzyme required for sulfatase activity/serine/threonine protein kinase